jgi:hypothetical protein
VYFPTRTYLEDGPTKLKFLESLEKLMIYFREYRNNNIEDHGFNSIINKQRIDHLDIIKSNSPHINFLNVDKFILSYCSDTSLFKNFFYYVLIRENFIVTNVFDALYIESNKVFYEFYKCLAPDITCQEDKTLKFDFLSTVYNSYCITEIHPDLLLYRLPIKDLAYNKFPFFSVSNGYFVLTCKTIVLQALANSFNCRTGNYKDPMEGLVKTRKITKKLSDFLCDRARTCLSPHPANDNIQQRKDLFEPKITKYDVADNLLAAYGPDALRSSWEVHRLALFMEYVNYPTISKNTNIKIPFTRPKWFDESMPDIKLEYMGNGKNIWKH